MRMRVKRKISICLALLLALSLCGCAGETMQKGRDYFGNGMGTIGNAKDSSAGTVSDAGQTAAEAGSNVTPAPGSGSADSGASEAQEPFNAEETPSPEETLPDSSGEGTPAPASPSGGDVAGGDGEATETEDTTFDIVFFGDSQFDRGREDGTSIPNFIQNLTRADSLVNFACGGTCAAVEFRQRYRTYDEWVSPNFTGIVGILTGKIREGVLDGYAAKNELQNFEPSKVDYYVIAYGYNDYQNEHEIFNQEWHQDPSAFAYALMNGIDDLRTISPKAQFIICTPCYAQFYNASGGFIGDGNIVSKGPYGYTLSDFAGSCRSVASDVGAMYFDAYFGNEMDLSAYTASDYLESDGVHLTFAGRNAYAQALAHNINKLRGLDDSEQGIVEIADYR